MLITSLIGKQVTVKLENSTIKGTLQSVGNHFILIDEKYINIAYIIKVTETIPKKDNCKAPFIVQY